MKTIERMGSLIRYVRGEKSLRRLLLRHLIPNHAVLTYYQDIHITKEMLTGDLAWLESTRPWEKGLEGIITTISSLARLIAFCGFDDLPVFLPYDDCLYAITRYKMPRVVVETGVERGASTFMILSAMKKAGIGQLTSIEQADAVQLGRRKVPLALLLEGQEKLKTRWRLVKGDSRKVLSSMPSTYEGAVDLFIAGSDHSYSTQKEELLHGKRLLAPNGLVIVDRPDYCRFQALNELFPERYYTRYVLPEKSANKPLSFAIIQAK